MVCHAGVNRVILCSLLGMPLAHIFRLGQDPGRLNIIERRGKQFRVVAMNCPVLENEKRRTSNAEHQTPNTKHRTPNTEHQTLNAEHRMKQQGRGLWYSFMESWIRAGLKLSPTNSYSFATICGPFLIRRSKLYVRSWTFVFFKAPL